MVEDDALPMEGPEPPAPEAVAQEVDPIRAEVVRKKIKMVQKAESHWEPTFKRMRRCMQIATEGADENWLGRDGNFTGEVLDERYVVPIAVRHINQAVAQLYARDPRAVVKRKRKVKYKFWDGKPESLQAAQMAMQPPVDAAGVPITVDEMGMPWQPDPAAVQMLQEIQEVQAYEQMIDKVAKTFEILWTYFTAEQANGFRQQYKALVRRVKVTGVGYVKLAFQRQMEQRPEIQAKIEDATSKLKAIEVQQKKLAEGRIEEDSAEAEELRLSIEALQQDLEIIVREGVVFDFPRSDEIILDPKVRHLKTLAGANWLAHRFELTPDEVEEIYGVNIKGKYTKMSSPRIDVSHSDEHGAQDKDCAVVYEIWDKKKGEVCTVCVGYEDFLRPPACPAEKLERFFTVFPLVFNEVENSVNPFPPSDIWLSRHIVAEYNRSREYLRQHRRASAPGYATSKGAMSEPDKIKLSDRAPHQVLEFQSLKPGDPVANLIQPLPTVPIDPNFYENETHFQDFLRAVGTQEANLGGLGGGTATESSIAENSRQSSLSDNVDDLDEHLSDLASSTGQLLLQELSAEMAIEIAGPGAVWPQSQLTREEIWKELHFTIKAGSSGRPNKAVEMANMERMTPMLVQLPGFNPRVLVEKAAELFDFDMEEAWIDGMPSITAMNAVMGRPATQPGTGDPSTDPGQQGQQGDQNAPAPQQGNEGPQPAMPSGAMA